MANRKEDLRQALDHQDAAWRSPDGVSEHIGFEAEPEVVVDETLVDVLRIFDEGQRNASNPYDLLDQSFESTPPFCSNRINSDDYSEDSRP